MFVKDYVDSQDVLENCSVPGQNTPANLKAGAWAEILVGKHDSTRQPVR